MKSEFQQTLSDDGQTSGLLDAKGSMEMENDSTTKPTLEKCLANETSNNHKSKRKRLHTQESRTPNNKKICSAKSKRSKQHTQIMKSSATSAPVSTGNEKVCKPFWNERSKEWSRKLWLCTKTDCVDSDTSSWNSYFKNLEHNSWFTARAKTSTKPMNKSWLKTSWQLSQCLPRDTMANASTTPAPKNVVERTKKIRFYPTLEQKRTIRKWMGAARWTYNRTVDVVMNAKRTNQPIPQKKETRKKFVNIGKAGGGENAWLLETPVGIRDKAWKQVYSALKTHKTLGRKRFQLKHRRKKDKSQTIKIDAREYGRKKGLFSFLKDLKCAEPVPVVQHEFEIMTTWTGDFFLLIPVSVTTSDNQARSDPTKPRRIISIDPGIRTFATCYDPSGVVYEVGVEDRERLCRMSWNADKLQRKIKEAKNHRQRYRMKRACRRVFQRRKHLVDELHHQLAYWLCSEFDDVIITTYRGSEMTRRLGRRLNRTTTRQMLTWSYYRFKQHMIHKSQVTGTNLYIVDEPYTSRTCGAPDCGVLKDRSGSKKFVCKSCGVEIDRDFNGSRNIVLRTLSL